MQSRAEQKGIDAQNAYNHPSAIRARAEEAGFNPLLFIGPGVGNQQVAASGAAFGQAVADAGLMLGEALAAKQKASLIEDLAVKNNKLKAELAQATLRPARSGVYAERETVPSLYTALGRGGVDAESPSDPVPAVSRSKLSDGLSYGGIGFTVRSDTSDAEAYETRYGELGSSVIGMGILAADLGTNLRRYTDRRYWEAETRRRQAAIDSGPVYYGRSDYGMPRPPIGSGGLWFQ